jgi:hypothetical protein
MDAAAQTEEINRSGLDSRKGGGKFLQGVEFHWTENAYMVGDLPSSMSDVSNMDRRKSRVFNDYGHFANFYRRMTGNGRRADTIRDIHYFVDGKRFNLNPPKPREII